MMRTSRVRILAIASVLATITTVVGPSSARAWSCVAIGCPKWCEAPGYLVGSLSDDLESIAPGTTVAELQRAMDDWGLVSCTALDPVYLGTTTATATSGDGMNVIEVVDADWPYDANVIGISTRVLADGCIVESDVQLNGENYVLVTRPGYQTEINAYSAALHEAGHFYGLGHSNVSTAAMYFRYGSGRLELKSDDGGGICTLYPGTGTSPDCTVTGCPTGQTCTENVCVDAPTPACTSDFDCTSAQVCNLATGACTSKSGTGTGLGTACDVDADCATGLCQPTADGSFCSQTCRANDPHSCPTGFHCSGEAISDCAIGVCLPGGMGTGAFLSACTAATDCASLYCSSEGQCSVPCERGVATTCPGGNGFVCHPGALTACGACGRPTALGGACVDSAECASSLCFDDDLDGRGVCAESCADDGACPDGFRCTEAGDDSLCLAPPKRRHGGCSTVRPDVGHLGFVAAMAIFCVTLGRRRTTKRRCRPVP